MGTLTNGQRSYTYYNITASPESGQLYMNDAPASAFSQINIDNEEVVFMQDDMSKSNDSFFCTISNQETTLTDQQFIIEVVPLIRRKEPFVALIETKTPLLQSHLDATQLSGLTNSNPLYVVQKAPRFGKLMRIVRSSDLKRQKRGVRDKVVWQFTHENVKNGVIHYVADQDVLQGIEKGVRDEFRYQLLAPGVQPANGVFGFTVVPEVI